jgi:hypothetical protein
MLNTTREMVEYMISKHQDILDIILNWLQKFNDPRGYARSLQARLEDAVNNLVTRVSELQEQAITTNANLEAVLEESNASFTMFTAVWDELREEVQPFQRRSAPLTIDDAVHDDDNISLEIVRKQKATDMCTTTYAPNNMDDLTKRLFKKKAPAPPPVKKRTLRRDDSAASKASSSVLTRTPPPKTRVETARIGGPFAFPNPHSSTPSSSSSYSASSSSSESVPQPKKKAKAKSRAKKVKVPATNPSLDAGDVD